MPLSGLTLLPLTPSRWPDLETLFGKTGAYGGCWCMWFRVTHSQFAKQRNAGNKRAMKKIVKTGEVPGLIAYSGDIPVGWVSVAPREAFPVLDRSRAAKRVDDEPVWSVVCFFVAKQYRRTGVTVEVLKAAVEYARAHGAKIVEGYPVEPKTGSTPDPYAYYGLASAFRKVGFVEVARHSETRSIMRYCVGNKKNGKRSDGL